MKTTDEDPSYELVVSNAIKRRRQWQPTPVLLPGESHGRRSLVGCSPWGSKELDTTERLHFHFSLSCIGEGNGNPLQCSCLENPRDCGAWWAAVYGVAQSWTRLKRLSSSSMSFESVMPSSHLILGRPLLLLPSVFLSIRVFSSELALWIWWPKYWSFSISPSNEYSGLISFRIDWFDLLAVHESPPAPQFKNLKHVFFGPEPKSSPKYESRCHLWGEVFSTALLPLLFLHTSIAAVATVSCKCALGSRSLLG